MRKKLFLAGLLVLTILYAGCGLAIFDDATDNFDNLIGDTIAEEMGSMLESIVSGTDDTYDENEGVVIKVLTPTPTEDPTLAAMATPFVFATPTPMTDEPSGVKVDEWVYATEAANVRSGWSTEYLISGGIAENDCVHRIAILSNGWSKISYNGTYAYVYGEYLTRERPSRIGTVHLDVMDYTIKAAERGEEVYILDVKNILQRPELVNGPEITSLAMVLKYMGYDKVIKTNLSKDYLKKCEPGEDTPFNAYVGDPSKLTGYGCYAPVIVEAANKWFADKNILKKGLDVTGSSMEQLLDYVKSGVPVICWTTVSLAPTTSGDTWIIDEIEYTWRNNEHCVVLCGYNRTKSKVIVCDPLKGLVEYDMATFYTRYKEQYASACIITNKY